MKRFFIDVDLQVDFCSRSGRLYVSDAEKILDNCEKLVNHAVRTKQLIVGSVDTHSYDSWEFGNNKNLGPNGEKPNFPVHCVKGTNGWLKMNDVMVKNTIFIPNTKINTVSNEILNLVKKPNLQAIYFEKEVYSMFANPNAEHVLDTLLDFNFNEEVEFVVFGVATDYCVKAAALGLKEYCNKRKLNSSVKLIINAIAGVTQKTTNEALEEMKNAGIELMKIDEYLNKNSNNKKT